MRGFYLSEEAEGDLDDVWFYIARESSNPDNATRIVDSIIRRFEARATSDHPSPSVELVAQTTFTNPKILYPLKTESHPPLKTPPLHFPLLRSSQEVYIHDLIQPEIAFAKLPNERQYHTWRTKGDMLPK